MLKDNIRAFVEKLNMGFLLFIAAIIYLLLLIKNDITTSDKMKKDEISAKEQIMGQEILRKSLSDRLKALDRNDYIERVAREKLGMVRKGEQAYKIYDLQNEGVR